MLDIQPLTAGTRIGHPDTRHPDAHNHITATLTGLTPGIYLNRDLYARYRSINGTLNNIHFARRLHTRGLQRIRAAGHRGWIIPQSATSA